MYTTASLLLAFALLFATPILAAFPAAIRDVSTITISASPTPTSPSFTDANTFQKDMLDAHNFYRGEHGVGALKWNETSAKYADKWAGACVFEHSHGPTGENLAAGYGNASASVDGWGQERTKYNFKKPGFSEATGHFTQLVWSNTTSVGCGRVSCNGKNKTPGFYVVCEYYPPGNVEGDNDQYFKDNVLKQKNGKGTDTVESGVTSGGMGWRNARWGLGVVVIAGAVGMGMVV